ncbi:tumor necrosis factor receptor superfamily member 25 isoform X2 [Dendropsophus ebraccatus]|uniref:tumor necrosis factor receptor superfamily member 25 isoform X2 n=1 Tax=Dendropsophus ebraccatus TaxID=150705 RepID=UPI003831EC8B
MKIFFWVLLLGWVYYTESVLYRNKNTLEKSNQRVNSSDDGRSRTSRSLQRHKRSNCDRGMFYDGGAKHCCRMCPRGHYVGSPCPSPFQNPVCKPCPDGTFLQFPNYVPECKRCTSCDADSEVEEVKCSAAQDAKCACKEGYYRSGTHCIICTRCHNRSLTKNCSTSNDTQCGGCLPGFYEDEDECQSCDQSGKQCELVNVSCSPVCQAVASTPSVSYILPGTFLLLLIPFGGLLIHKHLRKKKRREHVIMVHEGGDAPGLTDVNQETRIFSKGIPGHVPSVLQKNCALYDIIDCVPVRRWKEFMRTLELPDKVIEVVEVETPNFRDQQYEMLRRWCQLQTASIEAVYQSLERMNLSRCAEELKEKIEHYS